MSKRTIELDKEYYLLIKERTALNERYEKLLSRFEIIGHVSDKYNYSEFDYLCNQLVPLLFSIKNNEKLIADNVVASMPISEITKVEQLKFEDLFKNYEEVKI